MESKKCQFCEHSNPADSKYCSECGGCLYLLPCPHCGAVTDVTAKTCYQCHGQLQAGKADAAHAPHAATEVATEVTTEVATPDARYMLSPVSGMSKFDELAFALPVAEASRSPSRLASRLNARPNARVAAGVALLVVIAALGYYAYHQRFVVNTAKPPATDIGAHSRGVPSSSGVIRSDAPAAGAAVVDKGAASIPLAGATSAAAAVPTGAKAVTTPAAGPLATERTGVNERGASSGVACAPAVAALGLCPATPAQTREAEADAVLNAANARPPGAGKPVPAEPARDPSCPQVSAALGLCVPLSTVPSGPAVPAVTHTQRKE
jgi:hypothetical protein